MEALLFFLLLVAVRGLWKQTKEDLARWRGRPAPSRRRRRGSRWWSRLTAGGAGFWGHQATHGFPTARHGLHDGWSRGREAHHRAQRAIAQNRAEYAEGRAELEPELADYRRRRAEALALIDRQRQQEEIDRAHGEALAVNQRRWLEQEEVPEQQEQGDGQPDQQEPVHGDGQSGSGYDEDQGKQAPADEKAPSADGQQEAPGPVQAPAVQETKGDEPVSETTYQGVKGRMVAATTAAEQHTADAEQSQAHTEEHQEEAREAKAWASVTADEMQALEVDAGTLGAMADHLSALDETEKAAAELNEQMGLVKVAWQKVQETAQSVTAALDAGGHGGVQEARDNAAAGGAQKEFYEEGASASIGQ